MGRFKKNKTKDKRLKFKSLMKVIAGVDEVGRGSLIGPVYAAAVILNKSINSKILKDSKTLTKEKREILFNYIKKNSIWATGKASVKEIEKKNILQASLLAMKRAIRKLKKKPSQILVDGNKIPDLKNYNLRAIVKGDKKIPSISAASIIAKVTRDKFIKTLAKKNKGYNWDQNFGYGTENTLIVSADIENQINELENEEKKNYMDMIGLKNTGLGMLIQKGYKILELDTYFTSGPEETRAWTIQKNCTAPRAAGEIHTDFEKGFIRAETISYEDFITNKGWVNSKTNGKMRLEGKDYVVKDGDVLNFRFNT